MEVDWEMRKWEMESRNAERRGSSRLIAESWKGKAETINQSLITHDSHRF